MLCVTIELLKILSQETLKYLFISTFVNKHSNLYNKIIPYKNTNYEKVLINVQGKSCF